MGKGIWDKHGGGRRGGRGNEKGMKIDRKPSPRFASMDLLVWWTSIAIQEPTKNQTFMGKSDFGCLNALPQGLLRYAGLEGKFRPSTTCI